MRALSPRATSTWVAYPCGFCKGGHANAHTQFAVATNTKLIYTFANNFR
jgi:hypothetical protein